MSYAIGSSVNYRHQLHTVEKFIPVQKVPTKCKLTDRGPEFNLYEVRNVLQPEKIAFAWERDLDVENKVEAKKEESVI